MSERAEDFKDTTKPAPTPPAPRKIERHEPYSPIEADPDRVPEMRAAALEETRRSASVQQFLDRQKAAHAERMRRGPPFAAPTWPTLPSEDEAQHAVEAARQSLWHTLECRDEAKEVRGRASIALEAGERIVTKLADELEVNHIDDDVAAWQAACIRDGRDGPLPESLQARRAERDVLAQRYRDARGAVGMLEADHAAAQQAHDAAAANADEGIGHVLDALLVIDASEMLACAKRAAELRGRITSVQNVVCGGRRHVLPVVVMQALRDAAAEQQQHHDHTDRWRDLVAALTVDADAKLPDGDRNEH